jgi:2,4-dienoyl-CoA reductase-like NADH-dependent reductase (Old Yellow Enzyme family)
VSDEIHRPESTSRLLEPLRLGARTASNRVVFGAHFTRFVDPSPIVGEPGFYGSRLAGYLERRAEGGVGTIIAGQAAVHPSTAYQMTHNANVWDPACIPGLRLVADAVHRQGALALVQLSHNGGVVPGGWSKLPALAPSPIAQYEEPPKPMTIDEIDEIVDAFATSAVHCAEAGLDGVEIHAAHGYLIHQFLTPLLNHRTDDYGGSFDNRLRFGTRVLEAVRSRVPADFVVGIRLVGDEEMWDKSGLTPDDCAAVGARWAGDGLVDFVNVSVGQSGVGMVRPMYSRKLLGVDATATVTAAVHAANPDVMTFAVHRIVEPEEAESVLERGAADAVCLVRALIADPDWVGKVAGRRRAEIRKCVGCNQGCYGNLLDGLPVTCVTNPEVGREGELGPMPPASSPRHVVVVGGGPAGLEAAWVAAARGHRVTLLERGQELGGKIPLAASLPGRGELIDLVAWRIAECERRGVETRLGVEADVDVIERLGPDAVIVATGAVAATTSHSKWHPDVIGADDPMVLDHEEALGRALGDADGGIGHRVVVLDTVGHIEGVALSELLASQGHEVTLAMPMATPMLVDLESMPAAMSRARRVGVDWRPFTLMPMVSSTDGVLLVDALARQPETLTDVETVIIRSHAVSDTTLGDELRQAGIETHVIGDAVAARLADRAVMDGRRAGLAV